MYHVAGTIITISLLYLTSLFFCRTGICSRTLHRKLWNAILAVSFIFTALAGIFIALQITYKWDVSFIGKLLTWHVEAGVAMGLTGIFHLLWHLPYFISFFKPGGKPPESREINHYKGITLTTNLFMVGFTSTSVQILLLREMMNISGGYELISGVFLGSWLIASAAGAALAGRSVMNDLRKINILFASGPFISMILLLVLSRIFFHTGEIPTFFSGMVLTLILLVPFCILSGFTFVKLIKLARESNNQAAGRSFSIETAGGIASGILLTFLTSGLMNTWELYLLLALLFLAYAILAFHIRKRSSGLLVKTIFMIIISALVISDPDIFFRQIMLPAIRVTATEDTPYGNLTSGEYYGETSSFYNHLLLSYQDDVMEREENIHFAMLQAEDPDRVLLISGNPGSHIPEIMKYGARNIRYVERDPVLASKAREGIKTPDTETRVENRDAYRYIKASRDTFDVIIMLLPPPSTLSLNRFYTTEFFRHVRERLSPGGIFMCSPGSNDYYFNDESINLFSSIHNSLRTSFGNVVPVAGSKFFFIASDKDISVSFASLAAEKNIQNLYVSNAFFQDDLTEARTAEIKELMDPSVKQNRTTCPVASFHFQSYNFSKSMNEKLPAILLLIAAFLIPLPALRRRNMIMYFSAASLAGFEIIILLAVQLAVGNMYQITGLVIAVLMAGLALGAGTGNSILDKTDIRIKALAIASWYILMATGINAVTDLKGTFLPAMLILFSVLPPAFFTGHLFRVLTLRDNDDPGAGAVYSADLAGSALGFILLSGVAVPALGIRNSIIMLSVFIFAGLIFGRSSKK